MVVRVGAIIRSGWVTMGETPAFATSRSTWSDGIIGASALLAPLLPVSFPGQGADAPGSARCVIVAVVALGVGRDPHLSGEVAPTHDRRPLRRAAPALVAARRTRRGAADSSPRSGWNGQDVTAVCLDVRVGEAHGVVVPGRDRSRPSAVLVGRRGGARDGRARVW